MKIHISNIYNAALSDRVKLQHKLAEAGHGLGMYELGIFSYPVDSDTPEQLSTRLDGLISSLEHGDRVILQLPTGNGREFEEKLADRVYTYTGHYPMFLISDRLVEEYRPMLTRSEQIMAAKGWLYQELKEMLKREASQKLFLHFASQETTVLDDQAGLIKLVNGLDQLSIDQDSVQISFAIHDNDGNYSSLLAVSLLSVMQKAKGKVCFHILHDDSLDPVNRRRLGKLIRDYGCAVKFYLMDNSRLSLLANDYFVKTYSLASLYRLFLPEVLADLDKVIYLDADIMANCDINELWQIDLQGKEIGAVVDQGIASWRYFSMPVSEGKIAADKYFNSGVIVMDLKQIRKGPSLWDGFINIYQEKFDGASRRNMPDQDILNLLFKDKVYYLPSKWNTITRFERENTPQLRPIIYHFSGDKLINFNNFTEYDQLYLEMRETVPWEKGIVNEMFLHLLRVMDYKLIQLQKLAGELAEKPKKLIFYGTNTLSMNTLCKILKPHGNDYFIKKDPIDVDGKRYGLPVKDFSSLEQEKKGEFIVIVLPDADDGHALERLEQLGLEYGVDYFVAPTLTTKVQGGYEL